MCLKRDLVSAEKTYQDDCGNCWNERYIQWKDGRTYLGVSEATNAQDRKQLKYT